MAITIVPRTQIPGNISKIYSTGSPQSSNNIFIVSVICIEHLLLVREIPLTAPLDIRVQIAQIPTAPITIIRVRPRTYPDIRHTIPIAAIMT